MLGTPVKSVLAWVYAYQYPVHRVSPTYIPDEPAAQAIFLAAYRQDNDKVSFLELNPVTARLLELIDDNDAGRSGEELLRLLANEMNYSNIDAFIEHGATTLDELRHLQILIGARAST